MSRFRYSRWDGTQVGFDLDADAILAEITDDLVHHGDVNAALRRVMQQGFQDRDGRQVQGMKEILDRLRQQRQERLEQHDLGGVYGEIAEALQEVVEQERAGIEELRREARESGDERRQEITEQVAGEKSMELDLLPPDLAGQVRSLQQYEFTSSEARERFEELMEKLREQLANQLFNQVSEGMQSVTPEDVARMKDMLAELNQMLEQRERGEEPDFDGFMERYGDLFPENPQTLDELLEAIAARMAAMQAMLNSMTPEQRAQLQQLSDELMEDMDLQWQMQQLGENLRNAFPSMGWDSSYKFNGDESLGWSGAQDLLQELGDLDRLEQLLKGAQNPGALAEVDVERARELLGDDAALSLERMGQVAKMLEDAGLIEQREGRLELTPRGIRKIGQNSLTDLFSRILRDASGRHAEDRIGIGHERTYTTKPYEFGDPFNLDIQRTIRNALQRAGGGTPIRLSPEDFEVEETETTTRASTVLMLDVSLSMPMRDNFLSAKKVAMALHALISSQFPRDFLGIVTFSKVARELRPEHLPEVSWDFDYGTNMQHGFLLSRQMLARQTGTKQIIMITDGEPTAHFEPGYDEPYFNYPPVQETVDATLREVNHCTRDGITINTFMLDANGYLTRFIEQLTQLNRGRAFFTTPETLGDYVLVDFLQHRRALSRGRRSA
jgi:uncharacterized protein with von Willebrand factor type A (vWA) domain